ncbi:MAG: undecaprenyldiphospho-muramoylpentapeptide beta-N-acetylglucosaminyltransferase [Candidatus Omnitrophica bacterium]|nr:undecaprenyldiphospho-muramoylpentapeptide beta-N-acetylglucosaminyltransferase [Candidatus Omnitrophota bacterium]
MKVLVTTGSSGGHIFPALGFLAALKEKVNELEVLLVLPKKNINLNTDELGVKVSYLGISSISPRLNLKNLSAGLNFFRATFKSMGLLLKFDPDIVVGFGSLASLPCVSLAWFLRITTLIHEQNVFPGRANRFLAHLVDRIAISFQETRKFLKVNQKKIVFTGNPLRKEIFQVEKGKARDFFGLNRSKFTILIMGGSQSSHRINLALVKALSAISVRNNLQVVHLAGESDFNFLREEYMKLGIDAKVFIFLKEMQYAYSAADLIISRAGATSISEIAFFKIPAIIVPYPYAYKHQAKNAQVLKKNGAALVIDDAQLDTDELKINLEALLYNDKELEKMRAGFSSFSMDRSNDLLAKEVISLTSC